MTKFLSREKQDGERVDVLAYAEALTRCQTTQDVHAVTKQWLPRKEAARWQDKKTMAALETCAVWRLRPSDPFA
jgi:hypothetical protein